MLTKKLSTKVFFGLICRPLSVRRGRVFFVEFFPGAFSSSVAPTKSLFGWSTYCRAPSSTKHCWMSFFGIQAIAFGRQVCTYEVRRKEYDDVDGFWGTVVRGLCTQEPPRTRFVVRYLCLHQHFFHVMIIKECDTKPLWFEL